MGNKRLVPKQETVPVSLQLHQTALTYCEGATHRPEVASRRINQRRGAAVCHCVGAGIVCEWNIREDLCGSSLETPERRE